MQKTEPTSPATQNAWDALSVKLRDAGVEPGKMFGMVCLKNVAGKAFAGIFGDALVFKLPEGPREKALALAGAKLFDPSGTGRPMKEWIVLPKAHSKLWPKFGEAAVASDGKAPAKATPKKAAKKTSSATAPATNRKR